MIWGRSLGEYIHVNGVHCLLERRDLRNSDVGIRWVRFVIDLFFMRLLMILQVRTFKDRQLCVANQANASFSVFGEKVVCFPRRHKSLFSSSSLRTFVFGGILAAQKLKSNWTVSYNVVSANYIRHSNGLTNFRYSRDNDNRDPCYVSNVQTNKTAQQKSTIDIWSE